MTAFLTEFDDSASIMAVRDRFDIIQSYLGVV